MRFGGVHGFGGSAEDLALVWLVLQTTGPRGNHVAFGGFGHDGYPLDWARAQGVLQGGSGGQRQVEKFRATFWDPKNLQIL